VTSNDLERHPGPFMAYSISDLILLLNLKSAYSTCYSITKFSAASIMQIVQIMGLRQGYPVLVETPKRHTHARKHAFWYIDRRDRSRNAPCRRAEKKQKREKPKDVTNRLFAQTTHVQLCPPNFSCGVGYPQFAQPVIFLLSKTAIRITTANVCLRGTSTDYSTPLYTLNP